MAMLLIMREDPLFLKQQFMQHGLSNNNNNKKAGGKDANTNKLQPDKAIVIDKTFLDQMDKKLINVLITWCILKTTSSIFNWSIQISLYETST